MAMTAINHECWKESYLVASFADCADQEPMSRDDLLMEAHMSRVENEEMLAEMLLNDVRVIDVVDIAIRKMMKAK